jgi:hypothetical protein
MERLVYINVAWMARYSGPVGDKAEGNFGFLKTNETAHESWNFEPLRGRLYGYVPRSAQIRISRLGANAGDEAVNGVTVVWISRNPRTKKTVIVGWYRNATIHRKAEHRLLKRSSGMNVGYQIETLAEDGFLLPIDARDYPIPTAKERGNLGQNPVWYGKNASFNSDVLAYVLRGGEMLGRKPKSPRQPDPELRWKVERAAVDHATAHYESKAGGSRAVKSVEKDGVGWDLEATGTDGETLKIEVKGLSGKDLVVELTPNEFAQMQSPKHRENYVIYVLLEALKAEKRAQVFRYDALQSKRGVLVWLNDDGQALRVEERVAARLSLAS